MERVRTLLMILACTSIAVLLFFLCDGISAKAQADQVTIRLQDYLLNEKDTAEAMRAIIREFESKFPSIKVEIQQASSFSDAVRSMEGDNPPDISRIETHYIPYLAKKKLVKNLDDYVKKTGTIEYYWIPQFAAHTTAPCFFKKKLYAVPQEGSPILLYINRDLFGKAGLDVEKYPRTLDQFFTCAKQLTQPDKNQWGFGGDFTTLPYAPIYLQSWFSAHNADFFDRKGKKVLIDKKEGLKAFSSLVEFHVKYHAMFPRTEKWTYEDAAMMFVNEKVAMMQGDFSISKAVYDEKPEIREKVRVVFFPGEVRFVGRSSSFCLSRNSKHPDEAWECLLYLTTRPSLLKLFEKARKFPARRWLYRGTVIEKDKDGGVFGRASAYTATPPIPPEWPEISAVLVKTLKEAFSGTTTPEKAIKDATKKIKKLM